MIRCSLLVLIVTLPAAAADKVPLSLKQAVEIALAPDGNARVQLATLAVAQAKARQTQALGALLPNLDGAIGGQNFTRNLKAFGFAFPGVRTPDIVGPITNFDARSTAGWSLFDFSAWKRLDAAKAGSEAARAESEAARNAVAENVARAYMVALRAEASVQLERANLQLSESLHKLAVDQKDAGTGTGIEVVRADVQLANQKQRLSLLENDSRRAHLQLARLLNVGLDKELQLTDSLLMPETNSPTIDEAMESARTNRPDLSAQQLREKGTRLSYEAVKWERLPSVQGYADAGMLGLDIGSSALTRTYGATLKIPIFDGGRRDARRAEAGIVLRSDQIRTADLRKQMELEVRLALDALATSRQQVQVAAEGLELSEREVAQAQRRYTNGVTSSIEVVDAQTRLERARDNRIAALYQYNQARIDLAAAMGVIHRIIQ